MKQEEVLRLFDQYHNMVYRLALTMLHSRQDAEDITQSVFLKLLDGKGTPAPTKERQWMATVTVNACRDLLRSFWRRNMEPLDEMIPFRHPEENAVFLDKNACRDRRLTWETWAESAEIIAE